MSVAVGARAALLAAALFLETSIVALFATRLDTDLFQRVGEATLAGEVPYRDFPLEYPPGSLPAFVVPAIGPAAEYGFQFKTLETLFGLLAIGAAALALAALGVRGARLYAGAAFLGFAPLALGPVVLIRYDLLPAALSALALALLLVGRPRLAFAFLAAGAAAKIYPLVLVPPAYLYVRRRAGAREAAVGAAVFAVVLVAVVAPFALLAPDGLGESLWDQAGRGLQVETVGASVLFALHALDAYSPLVSLPKGAYFQLEGALPDALATVHAAAQALAVLAVWALFARSRRDDRALVLAAASAVACFVLLGKVLSPQFLIWLIPLVPLVRGRVGIAAGTLFAVALVLTHLLYPGRFEGRYQDLVNLHPGPAWLLLTRNAVLLALAAVLVGTLYAARPAARRAETARGPRRFPLEEE